jgi:hypothetical protein
MSQHNLNDLEARDQIFLLAVDFKLYNFSAIPKNHKKNYRTLSKF